MRLVLAGSGSFIARAVGAAAAARGIDTVALRHDQPLREAAGPRDCVINFAIHPAYRTGAYDEATDCDLGAARDAAQAGAHFIMLSTRRVYEPQSRWDAREDGSAGGDETAYGRNKAVTETRIRENGGSAAIFRLSNIFGYEYDAHSPRRSFLGQLLGLLKRENRIFFDMHPQTRRDFLPVEICAEALVDRALDRNAGTWNLGSGVALPCIEIADGIRQGYGGGELECDPMIVRDEFFLNMDKWRGRFALPVDAISIRDYCVQLGRRLACEKS